MPAGVVAAGGEVAHALPCTTPTETGTSCRFCSRCSAVTVIVSRPVGVGALSCAAAPKRSPGPGQHRPGPAGDGGRKQRKTTDPTGGGNRNGRAWNALARRPCACASRAAKGRELRKRPLSPNCYDFVARTPPRRTERLAPLRALTPRRPAGSAWQGAATWLHLSSAVGP